RVVKHRRRGTPAFEPEGTQCSNSPPVAAQSLRGKPPVKGRSSMSTETKTELDYRALLDAFAKTTAEACTTAMPLWQWPERMHEPEKAGTLNQAAHTLY